MYNALYRCCLRLCCVGYGSCSDGGGLGGGNSGGGGVYFGGNGWQERNHYSKF